MVTLDLDLPKSASCNSTEQKTDTVGAHHIKGKEWYHNLSEKKKGIVSQLYYLIGRTYLGKINFDGQVWEGSVELICHQKEDRKERETRMRIILTTTSISLSPHHNHKFQKLCNTVKAVAP